jgi:hypothetical protein
VHLERRLQDEEELLRRVEHALEQLEPELGEPGRLRSLVQLRETLRDCRLRHMQLHGRVIGAKDVFLAEQARQAFLRPGSLRLFDVQEDLLKPLLGLPRAQALPMLERFFTDMIGPRSPRLGRLQQLLELLLRPPLQRNELGEELEEPEFVEMEDEQDGIPEELWQASERLLAQLGAGGGETRLSQLVARAREQAEHGEALAELVRLRVLQRYGAELGDPSLAAPRETVLLVLDDGRRLAGDPCYSGADLAVVACERSRLRLPVAAAAQDGPAPAQPEAAAKRAALGAVEPVSVEPASSGPLVGAEAAA